MMPPEKGPHATATDAPDEIRGTTAGTSAGSSSVALPAPCRFGAVSSVARRTEAQAEFRSESRSFFTMDCRSFQPIIAFFCTSGLKSQ